MWQSRVLWTRLGWCRSSITTVCQKCCVIHGNSSFLQDIFSVFSSFPRWTLFSINTAYSLLWTSWTIIYFSGEWPMQMAWNENAATNSICGNYLKIVVQSVGLHDFLIVKLNSLMSSAVFNNTVRQENPLNEHVFTVKFLWLCCRCSNRACSISEKFLVFTSEKKPTFTVFDQRASMPTFQSFCMTAVQFWIE